jgi:hypothetical protein
MLGPVNAVLEFGLLHGIRTVFAQDLSQQGLDQSFGEPPFSETMQLAYLKPVQRTHRAGNQVYLRRWSHAQPVSGNSCLAGFAAMGN